MVDRTATVHFLHDVLGMHALRHEEFKEGCKAACNGPYDGMWSKTMMGYDSEVWGLRATSSRSGVVQLHKPVDRAGGSEGMHNQRVCTCRAWSNAQPLQP